jgi:enamine deaminase RidA (YjgF/YER057c/UK114 family)
MSKTYLNPQALFPSQQYGFSQGVATLGKTTVYVSGQVGWNAMQQITEPADLGVQTRQALENIEVAFAAAGLDGAIKSACVSPFDIKQQISFPCWREHGLAVVGHE